MADQDRSLSRASRRSAVLRCGGKHPAERPDIVMGHRPERVDVYVLAPLSWAQWLL